MLFLYIIGGIVAVFLLLIIGVCIKFRRDINKPDKQFVVDFIEKNKENPSFSVYAVHNDRELLKININKTIPLASTVKIIIAIEYAYQASKGMINPNERITMEELDRHYVKNSDGGAHSNWLKTINPESITLEQVAKGMIAYSSNANTDFLLTKLGIQNVNQRLQMLNLVDHTTIYPLVSITYVPLYLNKEKHFGKKEIIDFINNAPMEKLVQLISTIHEKLLKQPFSDQEKLRATKWLSMDVQKALSNKLPSSTTNMYIQLMQKLNSKAFFSKEVHQYLDPIMEQAMEQETYRQHFKHLGRKGGSTVFLITKAMYATDKNQNTFEFAFFANDLTIFEQAKLTKNLRSYYESLMKEGSVS